MTLSLTTSSVGQLYDLTVKGLLSLSATGLEQIVGTLPGQHLVETFPILKKLPMALKPWEKHGRSVYERDLEWCRTRLKVSQTAIESLDDR